MYNTLSYLCTNLNLKYVWHTYRALHSCSCMKESRQVTATIDDNMPAFAPIMLQLQLRQVLDTELQMCKKKTSLHESSHYGKCG